ncbi:hypothetical protein CDAR_600841 [Caerostris darwini]|uniref:Uncharacterized protein n=1 Tax=Caerostris darwini TaxID=1538125 RepID=A0AAV4TT46_9ARAC|nr:hypothetical protein CDAR_600841 [Caerostris darwini]
MMENEVKQQLNSSLNDFQMYVIFLVSILNSEINRADINFWAGIARWTARWISELGNPNPKFHVETEFENDKFVVQKIIAFH